MAEQGFIELEWKETSPDEMKHRSNELLRLMQKRRTTRHFATKEVPKELIEDAIMCAGTAPSGAHLQPWTFVANLITIAQGKDTKCSRRRGEKNLFSTNARCLERSS